MPCDDGDTDAAIAATPAALELIPRLSAAQGPPMFFQSGVHAGHRGLVHERRAPPVEMAVQLP
jgi:uncharacterized protein (DUF779 family)